MATNATVDPPTEVTGSTEYVCTLSDEMIRMAEEELNEKAQWRSRDIQALREMINKKPELRIRTDDVFLLRFLRAKKFDYDRAFALIIKHYTMKVSEKNKQLFTDLRPSAVKHVLEAGVTGVLPHRDKLGRRVIVFRPGKWDPSKFSLDDVFRTNFITLTKLIEEDITQVTGIIMLIDMDGLGLNQATNVSPFYAKKIASLLQEEQTQVSGVIMLTDLKSLGFKHAKKMSPFYAKRIMSLLQDCFPMRFKGIHYINEPSVFDYIFAIVKPFMKEKILNRIHFHGTKYQELTEFIDTEHLPSDYGGTAPPFSNTDWTKTLLECDAEFDAEAKYGLIKPVGKQDTSCTKDDALDCLAGSYRKMDI